MSRVYPPPTASYVCYTCNDRGGEGGGGGWSRVSRKTVLLNSRLLWGEGGGGKPRYY